MNCREIDMSADPRGAHFAYFCSLASPAAGLTVPVDVNDLRKNLHGRSFFLAFLWCVQHAANAVPELRRRIKDGRVWEFDHCPTSCTVMKEDGTYAYCHLDADGDFDAFHAHGLQALREAKERGTIDEIAEDALPCYFVSCVPWLSYTQAVNPWGGGEDSNPRITWGKYESRDGRTTLPLTLMIHHGLADGLHIARFYERLQQELENLSQFLQKYSKI